MPLFKSRIEESPPPPHNDKHKGGLFHRRSLSPSRSGSQESHRTTRTSSNNRNGLFGRRSTSSDSSLGRWNTMTSKKSGSFFGLGGHHDMSHDPSIMAARKKVHDAEEAERAADRALADARGSVREAHEHARFLEQDAHQDALRAKAKQAEAKVVSKTAHTLGRHG